MSCGKVRQDDFTVLLEFQSVKIYIFVETDVNVTLNVSVIKYNMSSSIPVVPAIRLNEADENKKVRRMTFQVRK